MSCRPKASAACLPRHITSLYLWIQRYGKRLVVLLHLALQVQTWLFRRELLYSIWGPPLRKTCGKQFVQVNILFSCFVYYLLQRGGPTFVSCSARTVNARKAICMTTVCLFLHVSQFWLGAIPRQGIQRVAHHHQWENEACTSFHHLNIRWLAICIHKFWLYTHLGLTVVWNKWLN